MVVNIGNAIIVPRMIQTLNVGVHQLHFQKNVLNVIKKYFKKYGIKRMTNSRHEATKRYANQTYTLNEQQYFILEHLAQSDTTYKDLTTYLEKYLLTKANTRITARGVKTHLTWLSHRGLIDVPNRSNTTIVSITKKGVDYLYFDHFIMNDK
jgi:ATP-dependent Lon protease